MRWMTGTGARDGTGKFLDALRLRREQDAPAEFALMAAMPSWITPCSTIVRWWRAFASSARHAIAGLAGLAGADEVPQARIEAIVGAAVECAGERAKERGVVTAYGRDGIPGVPDIRS